jgi:hypothetical protein
MINYYLTEIDESIDKSISKAVERMCKANNINYTKQEYKILFSSQLLSLKNNNVVFTSGAKKYLSFYGRVYMNKDKKIIEKIHLDNTLVVIDPPENSILVVLGGVQTSTEVEQDSQVLHFYVAPAHLLKLHDPLSWKTL